MRIYEGMSEKEARFLAIADRLAQNCSTLRYGACTVELQIHDGRVCTVTYSTTEKTRSNTEK